MRCSCMEFLVVVRAPQPRRSFPVREKPNCHLVAEPEAEDPRRRVDELETSWRQVEDKRTAVAEAQNLVGARTTEKRNATA